MSDELTCDAFLGGKIHLFQPKYGFRAGIDTVLLAATVPAKIGDRILDLGCGAGAAALCLGARVQGLSLTGIELQPKYADLARKNGGDGFEVFCGDLTDMPSALRQQQFDHVLANPPYFSSTAGRASVDSGRQAALREITPLSDWVKISAKRLAPKGYAHFVQRVDRLPEILSAMQGRLGNIETLPLASRVGRAPELVLVRGRKNGKGAFKLHAPLILHEGVSHEKDGDSYVSRVAAVLRHGAALEFLP